MLNLLRQVYGACQDATGVGGVGARCMCLTDWIIWEWGLWSAAVTSLIERLTPRHQQIRSLLGPTHEHFYATQRYIAPLFARQTGQERDGEILAEIFPRDADDATSETLLAAMSWVACYIEQQRISVQVATLGNRLFDADVTLADRRSCYVRVTLILETGPRLR